MRLTASTLTAAAAILVAGIVGSSAAAGTFALWGGSAPFADGELASAAPTLALSGFAGLDAVLDAESGQVRSFVTLTNTGTATLHGITAELDSPLPTDAPSTLIWPSETLDTAEPPAADAVAFDAWQPTTQLEPGASASYTAMVAAGAGAAELARTITVTGHAGAAASGWTAADSESFTVTSVEGGAPWWAGDDFNLDLHTGWADAEGWTNNPMASFTPVPGAPLSERYVAYFNGQPQRDDNAPSGWSPQFSISGASMPQNVVDEATAAAGAPVRVTVAIALENDPQTAVGRGHMWVRYLNGQWQFFLSVDGSAPAGA